MAILIIVLIAVAVGFFLFRTILEKKSKEAIARFELPADSTKESFMDPKTGKRYDKEAYDKYVTLTVQRLSVPQLQNVTARGSSQGDIWNALLYEAAKKELDRRQEATAAKEEDKELEAEEICDDVYPFFWVEQNYGASVGLTTGSYLKEQFAEHGMTGSEKDWEILAKAFLKNQDGKMRQALTFESQEGMFGVYSKDTAILKNFIYVFHSVCEDPEALNTLFESLK